MRYSKLSLLIPCALLLSACTTVTPAYKDNGPRIGACVEGGPDSVAQQFYDYRIQHHSNDIAALRPYLSDNLAKLLTDASRDTEHRQLMSGDLFSSRATLPDSANVASASTIPNRDARNIPLRVALKQGDQSWQDEVLMIHEGTRPLLVEIQALVDHSMMANPRRVAVGLEQNRLAILLAVLHRHGGLQMSDQDVFVNVVGGVKVTETSADLALLLAMVSSLRDRPLPQDLVVFGEVGLAGEIRPVPSGQERISEAAKHGFRRAIVPAANVPKKPPEGMLVFGVKKLADALSVFDDL